MNETVFQASSGDYTATCDHCHTAFCLDVSPEQVQQWRDGALIQCAMPELTPGERELLISRLCGGCFDAMFADEDEQ